MQLAGDRAFQREGRVGAKVLRQELCQYVAEQRGQGVGPNEPGE